MNLCWILLTTLFTFVELNCENLFDYRHEEGKDDMEWTVTSPRHWNKGRYWRKLNNIGQEIISCGDQSNQVQIYDNQSPSLSRERLRVGEQSSGTNGRWPKGKAMGRGGSPSWQLPDMVALCEVENDSVLKDLTERSVLRNAGYRYLITHSPDLRGIDVALLYSPASFGLIRSYALRVKPLSGMRPTRDILYACGETVSGDTLHVFVVHAPSRFGGERQTRPNRRIVGERLMASIDSIRSLHPQPRIIVAGDFNDGDNDPLLKYLHSQRLHNISEGAMGHHGAKATYKYQGKWENIDHILVSSALVPAFQEVYVHDPDFLLEEDTQYGGKQPHRNYNGMRYQRGFSDHLPLVARFRF